MRREDKRMTFWPCKYLIRHWWKVRRKWEKRRGTTVLWSPKNVRTLTNFYRSNSSQNLIIPAAKLTHMPVLWLKMHWRHVGPCDTDWRREYSSLHHNIWSYSYLKERTSNISRVRSCFVFSGPDTGCTDWGPSWSSPVPEASARIMPQIRSRTAPWIPFISTGDYSSAILQFFKKDSPILIRHNYLITWYLSPYLLSWTSVGICCPCW